MVKLQEAPVETVAECAYSLFIPTNYARTTETEESEMDLDDEPEPAAPIKSTSRRPQVGQKRKRKDVDDDDIKSDSKKKDSKRRKQKVGIKKILYIIHIVISYIHTLNIQSKSPSATEEDSSLSNSDDDIMENFPKEKLKKMVQKLKPRESEEEGETTEGEKENINPNIKKKTGDKEEMDADTGDTIASRVAARKESKKQSQPETKSGRGRGRRRRRY